MSDHYATLGLEPLESDPKKIKKAYRKLALKYHPDKNKGNKRASELYVTITKAYETLSDVDAKIKFDAKIKGQLEKKKRNQKRSREVQSMREKLERMERKRARKNEPTSRLDREKAIRASNQRLVQEYRDKLAASSTSTHMKIQRHRVGVVLLKWKKKARQATENSIRQRMRLYGNILQVKILANERKALVCFDSTISAKAAASQSYDDMKVKMMGNNVTELFGSLNVEDEQQQQGFTNTAQQNDEDDDDEISLFTRLCKSQGIPNTHLSRFDLTLRLEDIENAVFAKSRGESVRWK